MPNLDIGQVPWFRQEQLNPNQNAAVPPNQPVEIRNWRAEVAEALARANHPPEVIQQVLEEFAEEGSMPKKKGKKGEELFQLILSGIREIYDVEAVIAGGAVRDLAAGVEDSKDVDVFIPLDWKTFKAGLNELFWQGPTRIVGSKVPGYPIKAGAPEVGCMFPTLARASSKVQGTNIDLVFIEKPLTPDNVKTFPVHTQRGIWTLSDGQNLSPEMVKDLDNKTFTIDPTITDKNKIKLVLEKVRGWQQREAYKDWKIVEPDVKDWWEAKEEMKKEEEHAKQRNKMWDATTKWGTYLQPPV